MKHTMTGLLVLCCFVFQLSGMAAGGDASFDLTATEKDFSLYFPAYLANGFFTTSTSLRGTDATLSFMVGVMDYTPGDVSRPAALPSWAEVDYFDGARWLNSTPVTASAFRNYRQTLRMYDGLLHTQYDFASGGRSTRVEVTTLVSEDATHLGLISLSLTPDFTSTVRLRFTLRPYPAPAHRFAVARLTAPELEKSIADAGESLRLTDPTAVDQKGRAGALARPPDPTAPDRAAMWYPGYVQNLAFGGSEAQRILWITGRAVDGPQIAEAAAISLPPGVTPSAVKLQQSPQVVSLEIALAAERGRTYTFTKYVAASGENWGGLKDAALNWAEGARKQGYDSLLAKHQAAWHALWKSDIQVEGDPEVQRVIHSDLFSLLENSTVNTGWGMSGCGLTPCYMGHQFWDNDAWDFPVLVLLQPQRAKSLEMFRYRTLAPAEARARERHYIGAMYPWESDPLKGTDVTPYIAVGFAEREIHVNADIAIANWEYYLTTGDEAWLRDYGYRVLRETADFWASRANYNREKDRYEILHVTSPDEAYNDVPNDAFTNAVAQKALRCAVAAAGVLGQTPNPKWSEVAQRMYIPFSVKEQRHLDFDETVPHNKKTWMGSSISWLAYPPLDLAMSKEIRRNDFNFATKSLSELTPDANDMVPVMLGIEAAELGDGATAYKWMKFSMGGFLKPPFNMRSETAKNNAIYNLSISAGFLENFIYGFTGLRFTDQGLSSVYPPVLPPGWKRVTLRGITVHNQWFDFIVSRDEAGKVHLEKRPAAP
ncbi:MAG: glycoside hydrolase family 65 protein [Terriglobia bacterium]|jgi:trehalose/maltose hydrolase-like predicted phosphorylase